MIVGLGGGRALFENLPVLKLCRRVSVGRDGEDNRKHGPPGTCHNPVASTDQTAQAGGVRRKNTYYQNINGPRNIMDNEIAFWNWTSITGAVEDSIRELDTMSDSDTEKLVTPVWSVNMAVIVLSCITLISLILLCVLNR